MVVRKKKSESFNDSDLPTLNSSGSVEKTVIKGDGVEPILVDMPPESTPSLEITGMIEEREEDNPVVFTSP